MAKKEEKSFRLIEIQKVHLNWLPIPIIGTTPFAPHKLSQDLRNNPKIDPAAKNTKIKKNTRQLDPQEEFAKCLYWLDKKGNLTTDGKDPLAHKYGFGFKSNAFKQGMVSAGRQIEGVKMTELKPIFHVFGAEDTSKQYVKIIGTPEIECEFGNELGIWVRIGAKGGNKGTPQIRYRATFKKWKTTLYVLHNPDWISAEQLFNLAYMAGFVAGIGEDRPESKKGGTGGMYRVGTV